ncbi:hypothetical protein EDD18DRAFT_1098966 [Armillaria luteobubalina]|uniref:Uncharacterized protein n=1 Tax=Armillaria luteobubalina TaxID=153913 RepID=A0AA39QKE7_9AGAR|nr:hypothetical protein EDD18DRAFT_1098966 [Armillaria luteobubalina]
MESKRERVALTFSHLFFIMMLDWMHRALVELESKGLGFSVKTFPLPGLAYDTSSNYYETVFDGDLEDFWCELKGSYSVQIRVKTSARAHSEPTQERQDRALPAPKQPVAACSLLVPALNLRRLSVPSSIVPTFPAVMAPTADTIHECPTRASCSSRRTGGEGSGRKRCSAGTALEGAWGVLLLGQADGRVVVEGGGGVLKLGQAEGRNTDGRVVDEGGRGSGDVVEADGREGYCREGRRFGARGREIGQTGETSVEGRLAAKDVVEDDEQQASIRLIGRLVGFPAEDPLCPIWVRVTPHVSIVLPLLAASMVKHIKEAHKTSHHKVLTEYRGDKYCSQCQQSFYLLQEAWVFVILITSREHFFSCGFAEYLG